MKPTGSPPVSSRSRGHSSPTTRSAVSWCAARIAAMCSITPLLRCGSRASTSCRSRMMRGALCPRGTSATNTIGWVPPFRARARPWCERPPRRDPSSHSSRAIHCASRAAHSSSSVGWRSIRPRTSRAQPLNPPPPPPLRQRWCRRSAPVARVTSFSSPAPRSAAGSAPAPEARI